MDIYTELKRDHDEVKEFLNELVNLSDQDEYRFVLIEQIGNLLIPHARAEEAVFYNTIRAVDVDQSIILHGFKEHMEAEALLRTLQARDKLNGNWKETAYKLKDSVEHHIAEEEDEIFSKARDIFSQDEASSMGEAFANLKPQVLNEGMIGRTLDMVINMMPPRLADNIRNFGNHFSDRK
jgi:hemerythrin superfamily protein